MDTCDCSGHYHPGPGLVGGRCTVKVKIKSLRRGDRIHGYPGMTVKRVYENTDLLGRKRPVIEFANGTRIYPDSFGAYVTILRERR